MGFFKKIFSALKKTKDAFGKKISALFTGDKIGEEFYEDLTDVLISSDVSFSTADEIVENLRDRMIEENVDIKSKINIKEDSKIVYASSFGVGGNNEELRLIVVNNKLVNGGDDIELVNESDLQIVMNYNTAIKLNKLLNKYIAKNR